MSTAPDKPGWHLSCRRLCVARGGRVVLRDIDLDLRPGECLSLIGPNGSGKTTLLLALLGLLRPQSGTVQLDGREMSRLDARTRGRFAAYVPQTIAYLTSLTIREVVALGRYPHGSSWRAWSAEDWAHVEHALQTCHLSDLAQRPIDAVSGGERQKAFIAAAMAQDAQVMLLDEPTTALDPAYQVELVQSLRAWLARERAVVVVSHDLQLPAVLGGRVLALRGGRVAACGDADEVLAPERLSAVYEARFVQVAAPAGQRVILPDWWQ